MIDGSASGSGFFSGAYPGPTPETIPGSLPGSFPGPFTGAFGGPTLNLPFGELAQGIDLMRTMWTQLLNSPITPTLDLEELERRIRDLKAVEQWLAVNQNLLRTTIQGLEIQRTTLATLKAFAGAMARPLHEEPGGAASNATGSSAAHAQAASTPSTAPPKSPGNAAGRPPPPRAPNRLLPDRGPGRSQHRACGFAGLCAGHGSRSSAGRAVVAVPPAAVPSAGRLGRIHAAPCAGTDLGAGGRSPRRALANSGRPKLRHAPRPPFGPADPNISETSRCRPRITQAGCRAETPPGQASPGRCIHFRTARAYRRRSWCKSGP